MHHSLIAYTNHYIKNLKEHEQGHVNIVANDVKTISKKVVGKSCNIREAVMAPLMGNINKQWVKYDADTNHGANRGVVWSNF